MTTETTTLSPEMGATACRGGGVLGLVREALAGTRHDFTAIAFGNVIVGVFNVDPVIVGYGTNPLRIISAGFLFYAFGMVVTQSFNGAGDTRTPTLINLFCFWLLELPVAWLLAKPLGLGPKGVFIAVLIGFSTMAIVASALFRRGAWKRVAV